MNERITPYDPELAKSITKEGQRIVRELTHALEDKISMNERIKQLALEAGLVRNGDFGMKRWEGPRSDSISDQDLEKFAELIVRDLIDSMIKRYGDDDELPIQEIEFFVKEYFGVEE